MVRSLHCLSVAEPLSVTIEEVHAYVQRPPQVNLVAQGPDGLSLILLYVLSFLKPNKLSDPMKRFLARP